jgi:hypothetical protein
VVVDETTHRATEGVVAYQGERLDPEEVRAIQSP